MNTISALILGGPGGSKYWPIFAVLWIGSFLILKWIFREQDAAIRDAMQKKTRPVADVFNIGWVKWLTWIGSGVIVAWWIWSNRF